ncbi:MAG: TatD family hydrolase [Rhodospirillales bacterium]|nr:TatD family hydrolase [Rhodospirillales bacterium]
MLVDSHCHLDFPDFADDLDGVVARARDAGVGHMLTVGTHVTRFDAVLAIADAYDPIFCSVGIHPHEAAKEPEITPEHLVRMASKHPKIVALGESGLDFHYEYSPRDAQEKVFRTHIAAARETGLPLIVHTREADAETIAILREEQAIGAFGGVIHCFSSGLEMAEAALDMGMYVSLSGIVTFKAAQALRDIVAEIPLDRLLVETDAPYLAPLPKRGKRNEPAFTAHTAARVAEIKGVAFPEFAETTTANFFRLFSKAKPCA